LLHGRPFQGNVFIARKTSGVFLQQESLWLSSLPGTEKRSFSRFKPAAMTTAIQLKSKDLKGDACARHGMNTIFDELADTIEYRHHARHKGSIDGMVFGFKGNDIIIGLMIPGKAVEQRYDPERNVFEVWYKRTGNAHFGEYAIPDDLRQVHVHEY
jgi:hypothetical protein